MKKSYRAINYWKLVWKIATIKVMEEQSRVLRENPQLIKWKMIETWSGELPRVTGGAIPFIDIDTLAK